MIHCSEFSSDLILVKNKVLSAYENEELSSLEFNSLLVTFGVFDSSARFWAPIESGGVGTGHSVLVRAHSEDGKRFSYSWRGAVTSDAASAGGGMIVLAVFGAVSGPLGWVALAKVATAAAITSAGHGIFVKKCYHEFCKKIYLASTYFAFFVSIFFLHGNYLHDK
ncbi:MAG: hypothetical protein P8I82_01675 [Flavobacteriales bacterium]|nr:hypothetical protein [Flavobacteriales bacterium]